MTGRRKVILLLAIVACGGVGYYAWQQQRLAKGALARLQEQEHIDFYVLSRPILAIDSHSRSVFLLYANETRRLYFSDIFKIRFIESKIVRNDPNRLRSPDSLQLLLQGGHQLRVGDLPESAEKTMSDLQAIMPAIPMLIRRQ